MHFFFFLFELAFLELSVASSDRPTLACGERETLIFFLLPQDDIPIPLLSTPPVYPLHPPALPPMQAQIILSTPHFLSLSFFFFLLHQLKYKTLTYETPFFSVYFLIISLLWTENNLKEHVSFFFFLLSSFFFFLRSRTNCGTGKRKNEKKKYL